MERSNLRLKPTFYSKTRHAWKCARSPKKEQQNLDLIFSLSTNLVGFFFCFWCSCLEDHLETHPDSSNQWNACENAFKYELLHVPRSHGILRSTIRGLYHQFNSVAQLCPTLCDPIDCNMPGLPVHHRLWELTQTHVHWVSDAIQPFHPLLSPSPPAFNLSQHQGFFPVSQLFTLGGQSIRISASQSVLPMNIQDWLPLR